MADDERIDEPSKLPEPRREGIRGTICEHFPHERAVPRKPGAEARRNIWEKRVAGSCSSSVGEWCDLDGVAKVSEPADEATGLRFFRASLEVIRPEVVEVNR